MPILPTIGKPTVSDPDLNRVLDTVIPFLKAVSLALNNVPVLPLSTVDETLSAYPGGGQAVATPLTKSITFITTVGTAGDSVKLPAPTPGMTLTVYNTAANACNVYPMSGGEINALGANAAYSLSATTGKIFIAQSTTRWRTLG